MSRKMKRVAFDCYVYGDDMARFKHQTLVQDFMELHQETEAARNNVLALKQKKLTLEAEVRFLRQRHKLLLQNKSTTHQERAFMNTQLTRFRKSKKDEVHIEKPKTLPPVGKKKYPGNIPSPEFDLKQQWVPRAIANQRVRVNGPKGSAHLDLRRKDIYGSQEYAGQSQSQTRKPVIDLNQMSREEEELQDQREAFESLTHGLIRNDGGGSGSSGRVGKRKISW